MVNDTELVEIKMRKNLDWTSSQTRKYLEREAKKIGITAEQYAARMNRNIYALFDTNPDFDKAHDEIHAAIGKFIETIDENSTKEQKESACRELNAVCKKWDHVGARDTAARENITNYIHKATGVGCFTMLTDAIFKE